MRTHLLQGSRQIRPRCWHVNETKYLDGHSWKEFTPYSNVLWLKYVFGYVQKNFKQSGGSAEELSKFEDLTRELKKKLNPLFKVENGAFTTAEDVYQYVVEKEWISAEQVAALQEDSSILSTA